MTDQTSDTGEQIDPDDFIKQADIKVQEIDAELVDLRGLIDSTRVRIKKLTEDRVKFARIAGAGVKRTRTVAAKQEAPTAPAAFNPLGP